MFYEGIKYFYSMWIFKIIWNCILLFECLCLLIDVSDGDYCNDFLVSGPTGVADDHLSASSHFPHHNVFGYSTLSCAPEKGRLHLNNGITVSGLKYIAAWCPDTSDIYGYIQVDFDNVKIVKAIKTQGREDYPQWVTSYKIAYSLNNEWSTIKNSQQEPMAFVGNNDTSKVVTNSIPGDVEAKRVRIYPLTFHEHPSLRFDIIGCKKINTSYSSESDDDINHNTTWRIHPVQIENTWPVLWNKSASQLGECAILCHKSSCRSFAFVSQTEICLAFQDEYMNGVRTGVMLNNLYYIRLSSWEVYLNNLRQYEYTFASNAVFRFYTHWTDVSGASAICLKHNTRLLTIRNPSFMEILQNFAANNLILSQRNNFRVDGQMDNGSWRFSDGTVIPLYLWAPTHPDSNKGECVVLTKKGLKSDSCSVFAFFICGFEII